MGARRGRSLRTLLASSLVFGSVAVCSVVVDSVPASATTTVSLYVVVGGTGDCSTLANACGSMQTAINTATGGTDNGDDVTIDVAAGTYAENDSISASSLNSLKIAGAGASTTTVNGNQKGSVLTVSKGTVTISGLTIENGTVGNGTGGGILNGGNLTVTDATISGNDALGGGGIESVGGTLTVSGSTISGNGAQAGGGIESVGGTLTVSGSTVWGNTAINGGGIASLSSSLTMTDSTLSSNAATTNGGGIFTESGNDNLGATIVAGNTGSNCFDGSGGIITSAGYNLTDDATGVSCGFTQPTDVVNAQPQFGPLADNGGPTETLLPALSSPAIGVIPASPGTTLNGVQVCPRTDQRGVASLGDCTIGAVEVDPFSITPNQVPRGASSATMAINGTGFVAPVTVTVSGTGVTIANVSVVSPTSLQVTAKVGLTAALGARNMTISDANGPTTYNGCLTVSPRPTLTSSIPQQLAVGTAGKVTFTGTGFETGATLSFSGPSRLTASNIVVTPTTLTATIHVPTTTTAGFNWEVTVINPDHSKATGVFLSVIPAPSLSSVSPSSVARGTTTLVILTGTGFAVGAKLKAPSGVTFSKVKVVNSTTISATMTVSGSATTGTGLSVTVTNNATAGYGKVTADVLTIT